MKQKIIITALPNGVSDNEGQKYLSVSAFLSIRLEDNDERTLTDFPDMLEWSEKIKQASFVLRRNSGEDIALSLDQDVIDDELWTKLFHEDIKVLKFVQEDLTFHRIHSYPVKHVQDFVMKTYKKLAIESPERLIKPDRLIDDENFGAISKFKIRDIREVTQQTGATTAYVRKDISEKDLLIKDDAYQKRFESVLNNRKFIPFNATANPKMDFIQMRDFHKLDRPPRYSALPKIEKPEFEFHDVVSIIGNYPQLQRKTALILDFEFLLPDDFDEVGTIRIIPQNIDFTKETEVSVPATAYHYTEKGFYVRATEDSQYQKGFVTLNSEQFTVYQVDVDGAAIKNNNMADNKIQAKVKDMVVRYNLSRSKALAERKIPQDEPEEEGVPTMRSAGVAIGRNGIAEVLHRRFKVGNNLQTKLLNIADTDPDLKVIMPAEVLYSDDVNQGFRMDVAYDSDPEKWYSLHVRQDRYHFVDSENNEVEIEGIEPDEGFTQIGAAEDTEYPEDLYAAETFLRWEGWSLSVRRPGYAINEADDDSLDESRQKDFVHKNKQDEQVKYAFDPTREFRLHAQSEIVKGTLPMLRFGRDYLIRVRTVDLAGNSVSLDSQAEDPVKSVVRGFEYMRFEALNNPVLLLGNPTKDGESNEHMVVRSNYDMTAKEYASTYMGTTADKAVIATRHLLPPKNSQQIAECHGKFDLAFGDNPFVAQEMYQLITSRDDLLEQSSEGFEKVYEGESVELVYLPDPMAAGVVFFVAPGYDKTHSQNFNPRLFGFFQNSEVGVDDTNINIPEKEWYKAESLRIRLEEGEWGPKWDAGGRIFTVFLPKGARMVLKYSSFWRKDDLEELSGLWRMIKEENPKNIKQLKKLAYSGRHWMLSAPRELELVHAVQQPVLPPEIEDIRSDRDYDDTFSFIHTRVSVHGNSTEKVDFNAKWIDPVDIPSEIEPRTQDGSSLIKDIGVNYHDEEIVKGSFPSEEHSDDKMKTGLLVKTKDEGTRKAVLSAKKAQAYQVQPQAATVVAQLMPLPLKHSFGDTKHRWVDYKPEGTTRYAEYFESLKEANELLFTREGAWNEKVNILSSARPDAPVVEYIIPTFEWRKSKSENVMRHDRLGGGLRIYMKRSWYSSGADEKLGIVLSPTASSLNKLTTMVAGFKFNPMITQWAIDPAFPSKVFDKAGPRAEDFRYGPTIDRGISFPGNKSLNVDVVGYPVEFDSEKNLWFADIGLNTGNRYFPFVKLALARYQEHSVRKSDSDVCLSPVVYPDFIQIVPFRRATVRFKKDTMNSKFVVELEGSLPLPAVGRQYTNYFEISFLDPVLGQPLQGVVDDGRNDSKMEGKEATIYLTTAEVKNSYFKVSKEFRLHRKYKEAAFEIIIKEYEAIPAQRGVKPFAEENQPRLVYADIFKVNAKDD